jgi:predicted amidohydrolase
MKIGLAQLRPFKGDLKKNIVAHKRLLDVAILKEADVVVFPELSLTGYEPKLCKELASHQDDERLDDFQTLSDTHRMTICVGMPTKSSSGVRISMIIFQPGQPRLTYSKQHLHVDELPYFIPGEEQIILTTHNKKVAPAICYESLLPEHSASVHKSGAQIYLASVAKSSNGIYKAFKHYPEIARQYSMIVAMSNCIGPCDDFESVGKSSIWNKEGILLGQLDDRNEGILLVDMDTEEISK